MRCELKLQFMQLTLPQICITRAYTILETIELIEVPSTSGVNECEAFTTSIIKVPPIQLVTAAADLQR